MTQSLPRPDVLVRQVLETQTEVTVAPVLRGCVVGPCKQVVEPQILTAVGTPTLNAQARVALPAILQSKNTDAGPPWVFTFPDRSALVFSVNEGLKIVVRWQSAGDRSASQIVKDISNALSNAGETGVLVETVGEDKRAFRLRTLEKNDQASLRLDPEGTAPASVLGSVDLTGLVLPNDVENKTITVSVNEGANQTITITNGATTPANLAAEVAAFVGLNASVVNNRLYIFSDVQGEGQTFEVVGGTLLATVGVAAGNYTGRGSTPALLTVFGFAAKQYSQGASSYSGWELEITRPSMPDPRKNLEDLIFEVDSFRTFLNGSGTSLTEIFRTSSAVLYRPNSAVSLVDDGDGDNLSPIFQVTGANFTAVAGSAEVTGGAAPVFGSLEGKTLILGDGGVPRVITFGSCSDINDVIEDIHEVFDPTNGIQASNGGGGVLRLTNTRKRPDLPAETVKGLDSTVVVYGGTVFTPVSNFIDPNEALKPGRWVGNPYPPKPGDSVYFDGLFVGKITKVAPGGHVNRLRLSMEKPLAFTANNTFIVATALEAGDVSRPYPNLLVDGEGRIRLKHSLLRSNVGAVSEAISNLTLIPGKADIYQSYTALRLDVSSRSPGLLQLQNTQMVEDLLAPVDERNPLALAAHIALRNCPDFQITALGVDATSADYPEGTPQAYARAATHLEAFDVYGIALLSHAEEVAEIFQTHVNAMSAPEGKLERLALYCPKEPTHALDTLVTSGSKGNTVGNSPILQFDTGVADLPKLLQEAGLNGTTFTPAQGVYLDLETDSKSYNIREVAGSVVFLKIAFVGDENLDGFYSTSAIPDTLVDVAFGIRIRGKKLELPNGAPDLEKIAEAMANTAERYSDRRLWVIGPDEAQFNIGGRLLNLPGYFGCAAIAGMLTQYPVSQSFTNLPMAAISRVTKSTGRFNEKQLSRMAGGGVYLLIQDGANRPVIARQAITSDSSSVEARMDIILKEVDLLAKLIRRSLRKNLGIVNITKEVMDDIGVVIDSIIQMMVSAPKPLIRGAEVLEIGLSPNAPDKVAVAMRAYPHYALNGIDVTIYTLGE